MADIMLDVINGQKKMRAKNDKNLKLLKTSYPCKSWNSFWHHTRMTGEEYLESKEVKKKISTEKAVKLLMECNLSSLRQYTKRAR